VRYQSSGLAIATVIAAVSFGLAPAKAETLLQALASAYANNPTLNAQRAALRATDEGVPQALSGYRPTVSGSIQAGVAEANSVSYNPRTYSLTVEQPIFTGFRTTNSVKMAETAVLAGREQLRGTEQSTLLSAVTAFMDLVKAQANLNLQKQNVDFLQQQLNAANDKLKVGEGTKTDVAQTQYSLAAGQSQYDAAVATLNTAIATYEQVIGHRPTSLGAAKPIDGLLPKSLDAALAAGMGDNPNVLAASYNIDVASYNVNVLEGAFLPTVGLTGTVAHSDESSPGKGGVDSASLMAGINIPIYTPGQDSKVREAKETLGQRRIEHDVAVASMRQSVISAWGSLDAARAQTRAADAQVTAQTLALSGIEEQHKVGQSTQLDVLNAQQNLLSAKLAQVTAQHDRVVAAYQLFSAVGLLNAERLGLQVAQYDATNHYKQVRDKWFGLRTPDGR
jgi:outer membrane protein